MKAFPPVGGTHPHHVPIPQATAEGLRSYREPDEPRPLQRTFLDPAGEQAWVDDLRGLLESGRADQAAARLLAELDGFDGALARLCKGAAREPAAIEGWEDLAPILAEWEGPPVTALTLGLTNPPDLEFGSGKDPEPDLLLSLYSDEAFAFSSASAGAVSAECRSQAPAWLGQEEDVEVYCAMSGLAELNGALARHKHRHFLRDGRDGVEGRAPGGYVEYVLGCWLRSTLFLQAVQRAVAEHGLPDGARLIVGAVEVHADFLCLFEPGRRVAAQAASASAPVATLTMKRWVPREELQDAAPGGGSDLRRRLVADAPPEAVPEPVAPRRGLLARLFGRRR